MPRRMVIAPIAAMVVVVSLGSGMSMAKEKSAPGGFEQKSPRQILAEVSGKKPEKVDRLVSQLGLMEAARKLSVTDKFLKALVKYKMVAVDYRAKLGKISEREAKVQKKAIIKRVSDFIGNRLAKALLGRAEEPGPVDVQGTDDLPVDTFWLIDYDEYYHWQHNDDGIICK